MPFDRQRRLVFLHIPKTAGTAIEQALGLFGPWQQENLHTGFGLIQSRDLLARNLSSNFLQHLTLAELEDLFPDVFNNARLFTVVRDPWTRLLSSYRNPDPDLLATTAGAPIPISTSSAWRNTSMWPAGCRIPTCDPAQCLGAQTR